MKVVVVIKLVLLLLLLLLPPETTQSRATCARDTQTDKVCARYGGGTWDRREQRCASGKRAAPCWQAAAMNSNSARSVSRGRCATERLMRGHWFRNGRNPCVCVREAQSTGSDALDILQASSKNPAASSKTTFRLFQNLPAHHDIVRTEIRHH